MTAPARRLEAVSTGLTARERALLILRAWLAGEDPDFRLRRYAPAEQKEELERVERAIDDWQQELHRDLWTSSEWLYQDSLQLELFLCLDAFLRREAALLAALGNDAPSLPALPEPGRWLGRDVPLLYGVLAYDDDEPPPVGLREQRDRLLRDRVRAVLLRWDHLVAFLAVVDEVAAVMGERLLHRDLANVMEAMEKKLLGMHEALQPFERFALPPVPSEERLEAARARVRWDDLRDKKTETGRPWMRPEELAALEAREAELAAELRNQS